MTVKILKRNHDFLKVDLVVGNYVCCSGEMSEKRRLLSSEEPENLEVIIRKKNDLCGWGEHPFVVYCYKKTLYRSEPHKYTHDEIKLMIKEHYYKHNEKFKKLQKDIQLFESIDIEIENTSREPIPEQVRFSVWRRDEGKCVKCGSNKGLEFDHIIPFSKGGSNTERNLQLLCEKCNRQKSAKI